MLGPPDMSSTVDRFGWTVTRYRIGASTTDANGYRTAGAEVSASITMHVTLPSGQQVTRLPEGIEPGDARIGYTSADLRVADPVTGARGDEIEAFGERYSVARIEPYRSGAAGSASYIAATLVRVRRTDPDPLPTEAAP